MVAAGATELSDFKVQPAAVELARKSPVSVIFEPVQGEHNNYFIASAKGHVCRIFVLGMNRGQSVICSTPPDFNFGRPSCGRCCSNNAPCSIQSSYYLAWDNEPDVQIPSVQGGSTAGSCKQNCSHEDLYELDCRLLTLDS